MRAPAGPIHLVLIILFVAPVAALADEDDPKQARQVAGPAADPQFPRDPAAQITAQPPPKPHAAPAFKLAYRLLTMQNLDGTDLAFNAGDLDIYAVSRNWIRIGIETEVGAAKGELEQHPSSAWYVAAGLTAGFQYPWRVTPFIEGRFLAGFIGGDVAGQTAISYTYMGGVDGGIELYLLDRFYLTAAIGWVHPIYRGVDVEYARTHPTADPVFKDFFNDTLTFKVGIGL
jgi:hypothetical protein